MSAWRPTLIFTVALAAGTCASPTAPGGPLTLALSGTTTLPAVGQTSQLTLTATPSTGPPETVTNQTTWASSDQTVATVSPTGLLTATGYGSATITASYQGMSQTATATVSLAGLWTSVPLGGNVGQLTWTITQSGNAITGSVGFIPGLSGGYALATESVGGTVAGTTFTWTMTFTLSADPKAPACVGVPFVLQGTAQIQPGGTSMAVTVSSTTSVCDQGGPGQGLSPNGEAVTFTKS